MLRLDRLRLYYKQTNRHILRAGLLIRQQQVSSYKGHVFSVAIPEAKQLLKPGTDTE